MPDGIIIYQKKPYQKRHSSDAERDDKVLLKYFN